MASVKYDTILSNFDGKVTLLQWLKKVEKAVVELTEAYEGKVSIADVPHKQATFALIKDVLTNLNGKHLSAYTRYDTEILGYEAVVILKNGADVDEDGARAYMRGMCGSDYLPLYDFDAPANTFFIDEEMQLWKPQYVAHDYGLALFKVATLPSMQDVDGLRHDLDETQEFTNSLNQRVTALEETPAKSYMHYVTMTSSTYRGQMHFQIVSKSSTPFASISDVENALSGAVAGDFSTQGVGQVITSFYKDNNAIFMRYYALGGSATTLSSGQINGNFSAFNSDIVAEM